MSSLILKRTFPGGPKTLKTGRLELCAPEPKGQRRVKYQMEKKVLTQVRKEYCFSSRVKVKVSVAQFCLTLRDPTDCSPAAPLSKGFSRHEYWNGWPFPSPGDLPDLGIEPGSPALQVDSIPSEPPGKHGLFQTSDSV